MPVGAWRRPAAAASPAASLPDVCSRSAVQHSTLLADHSWIADVCSRGAAAGACLPHTRMMTPAAGAQLRACWLLRGDGGRSGAAPAGVACSCMPSEQQLQVEQQVWVCKRLVPAQHLLHIRLAAGVAARQQPCS